VAISRKRFFCYNRNHLYRGIVFCVSAHYGFKGEADSVKAFARLRSGGVFCFDHGPAVVIYDRSKRQLGFVGCHVNKPCGNCDHLAFHRVGLGGVRDNTRVQEIIKEKDEF
jgi:hypothetical protein